MPDNSGPELNHHLRSTSNIYKSSIKGTFKGLDFLLHTTPSFLILIYLINYLTDFLISIPSFYAAFISPVGQPPPAI